VTHPLSCDCAMCSQNRLLRLEWEDRLLAHSCASCGMAHKCDGRLRAHALDDALNGFYLDERIFESALGAKCKLWRKK